MLVQSGHCVLCGELIKKVSLFVSVYCSNTPQASEYPIKLRNALIQFHLAAHYRPCLRYVYIKFSSCGNNLSATLYYVFNSGYRSRFFLLALFFEGTNIARETSP